MTNCSSYICDHVTMLHKWPGPGCDQVQLMSESQVSMAPHKPIFYNSNGQNLDTKLLNLQISSNKLDDY